MSTALKNVVIIGGCGGGAGVAHELEKTLPADHRLVLIEENEFAFWPIGGLRAACEPGYEKKVFASLDGFFGAQSRHIVLAGYKVTEVTENAVKLDRAAPAPFDGDTIPIEVGVIATGSSYAIPMRPLSSKLSEAQEGLRTMQGEIKSAKHIVVVGGGPVGVEFAGEVLEQHPGKKITLVHMGDSLLTGYRTPLGKKLFDQLRSRKVDVRLNTSVDLTKEDIEQSNRLTSEDIHIKLSDGSSLTTDFLFLGTGGKPNTAVVPSDALDKASPARIDVNASTLRLAHPSLGKKWFALGDASNAPGSKTLISAKAQAPIVAAQVKALLGSTKSTKVYKEPGQLIVVPIGKSAGASQLMYPVFGEWVTSMIKSKTLLNSQFVGTYPGGLA